MFTDVQFWIAIVTIAGGLLGNVVLKRIERRNERRSISAALRGEIKAYLEIVDKRDYVNIGKNYLANFKAGNDGPMPRVQDKNLKPGEILEGMFPIFYNHMNKIGILGEDVAEQLAQFYSYWKAIHIDLINFARGDWDLAPLANKIKIIEDDLNIYTEAKRLGDSLINRLL